MTTPAGVGTKKETVVRWSRYTAECCRDGLQRPRIEPTQPRRTARTSTSGPNRRAGAAREKSGNVFFVIAAFSAINAVLILVKAPIVFALGLAITRVSADMSSW